jgi:hypothetical protein
MPLKIQAFHAECQGIHILAVTQSDSWWVFWSLLDNESIFYGEIKYQMLHKDDVHILKNIDCIKIF